MLVYDSFYRLLGENILLVVALNEHIPEPLIFDFTLSDLNFSSALVLEAPDGLTLFAYNETDCIVWDGYDVS